MSKRLRRILITALVLLTAIGVLAAVFNGSPRKPGSLAKPAATPAASTQPQPAPVTTAPPSADPVIPAAEAQPPATAAPENATSSSTPPAAPAQPIPGLKAIAAGNDLSPRDQPLHSLGSLDPRAHILQLEFSRQGASIARVAFSDIWNTAEAKRKAERYLKQVQPSGAVSVATSTPFDFTQVDESQRYVLQNVGLAYRILVNGQPVDLVSESAWSETAPGRFESHIVDADGHPILAISRQFTLGPTYDITLQQTIKNISSQPVDAQWIQLGPTDLAADVTGYIDRRRFDMGYLPDPTKQPDLILTGEFEMDRSAVLKQAKKVLEATDEQTRSDLRSLWPNKSSRERGYHLGWFASMNRYFTVAIHPSADAVAAGAHSLQGVLNQITVEVASAPGAGEVIVTKLYGPAVSLTPGGEKKLDMGLYVGPLDRAVLAQHPFSDLSMGELILYRMAGGCCTFMTFQWLAKLLLGFLSLLHNYIVFDWGVAIMLLVVVVRILLHPLTKKSQINMQRFGKQMAAMKPEIDNLQKKFGTDPKRMQAEQMKLMREHGINPLNMLGCLPMFLQMPIWIALWAMLYLAFDIRHQSAFYGLFQSFADWKFLGDLSSPDHFWILPGVGFTIPFIGVHIDALNLLPLLMGVVFFFQQKYMSPPPSPNMTPEQKQQQKIMKVMMVLMMPIFLYKAPSGLTLYIFTSTCIGIMESKYIRSHVNQLDLGNLGGGPAGDGPNGGPGPAKPKKPKDSLGKLWAEKLEAARAKRQQSEPPKSFKKRK